MQASFCNVRDKFRGVLLITLRYVYYPHWSRCVVQNLQGGCTKHRTSQNGMSMSSHDYQVDVVFFCFKYRLLWRQLGDSDASDSFTALGVLSRLLYTEPLKLFKNTLFDLSNCAVKTSSACPCDIQSLAMFCNDKEKGS